MLVEISVGLLAADAFQDSFSFRAPMHEPIGCGLLLGLLPLGPFARGSKIDEITHCKLGGHPDGWL
jgi:hypothetical protein